MNKRHIRKAYLKGWFVLDFLSSFPLSYIMLAGRLMQGNRRGERNGYQRLLRLTKVMRLSRAKRVLKKYEDSGAIGDVTPYLGTVGTIFVVIISGHFLTCLWYYFGMRHGSIICEPGHEYVDLLERIGDAECLPNGDGHHHFAVAGWVLRQQYPNSTTISTKYIDSMYSVFVMPDIAGTGSELKIALMSELVLALIVGCLAGVMSSIMMTMGAGQQEAMVKLLALRAWMRARGMKTSDKAKILAAFHQQAESAAFDQRQILSDLPPSLATDLSFFMYGKYIERMPLFRCLGTEVVAETCKCVMDLCLSRDQVVYQEGKFGTEMYFLVSGEVEVSRDGERLGFLAEGAFFGETPLIESISGKGGNGSGIRTRTVRTLCSCDLGVIYSQDMRRVMDMYPELWIRLNNFNSVGKSFTSKGKRQDELRELKQQSLDKTGKAENADGAGEAAPVAEDMSRSRAAQVKADVAEETAELRKRLDETAEMVRGEMAQTRQQLLDAISAMGVAGGPAAAAAAATERPVSPSMLRRQEPQ